MKCCITQHLQWPPAEQVCILGDSHKSLKSVTMTFSMRLY